MSYTLFKVRRTIEIMARQAQARWLLMTSANKVRASQNTFRDIEKLCIFIGYPRSGHSLAGSLLDAHPEAIIAHELDILMYIGVGYLRSPLYYQLLRNAQRSAKVDRLAGGYTYNIPNQWQGRYQKLRVIGDKKGGRTALWLQKQPALLDRLREVVSDPIRFIHIMRNPYDNITTISKRNHFSLERSIDYYFTMSEAISALKTRIPPTEILDLRHENLIRHPRETLVQICQFLDLEARQDYIEDCQSILYDKPRQTRRQVEWSAELKGQVNMKMANYKYLDGYTFDT